MVKSIDPARQTITVIEMNWGVRMPDTTAAEAKSVFFDKTTTITLPVSNLNRAGAKAIYYFRGYIFPRKSNQTYIYRG